MTDPIQHLRELMAQHRSAVITRQMSEDDDPQRYEDACDMEDEAAEELKEALRNLAPQLLEVVESARDIAEHQDLNWSDTIEHRQRREARLLAALAALGGKGGGG